MRRKVRMTGEAHMGGRKLTKGETIAGYEHDLQALVHAKVAEWADLPPAPEPTASPPKPKAKKGRGSKSPSVKPEAEDGA